MLVPSTYDADSSCQARNGLSLFPQVLDALFGDKPAELKAIENEIKRVEQRISENP